MSIKFFKMTSISACLNREEMAPRGRNREAVSGGISDDIQISLCIPRKDIDIKRISISLCGVIQISKAIVFYMTSYKWINIKSR